MKRHEVFCIVLMVIGMIGFHACFGAPWGLVGIVAGMFAAILIYSVVFYIECLNDECNESKKGGGGGEL